MDQTNTKEQLLLEIERIRAKNIELEKYKTRIEQVGDSMFICDLDGNILDVNNQSCKSLGYSHKEFLSMKVGNLDATYVNLEQQREFWNNLKIGEFQIFESSHRHKDNSIFPVEISLSLIEKNGEKSIIGFARDISERKLAVRKLHESEERYRTFFENNDAVIMFVSPQSGKIIFANNAAVKYYGYSKKQLLNMNINKINVLSQDEIKAKMAEAFKQKQNNFVFKHRLANGNVRIVEVYQTKLFLENDIVFSIIVNDITERKIAEEEIIKLTTAIEQSPSVIAITDINGDLEYVNPKFTDLTGYSKEESLKKNPRFLKTEEADDNIYSELWKTITEGKVWRGDFHNKKKNGEYFWESASISPVINSDGEIANYIKVSEDITDRKLMEDALRESENRQRTIVDSLYDAMHIIDTDLRIRQCNKRLREWCNELGLDLDIIGKNMQEAFPFISDDDIIQYKKVLETGDVIMTQEETNFNDNTVVTETRKIPLKSSDKTIGVITIVSDITSDRNAVDALKNSERRFSALMQQSPSVIEIYDLDGLQISVNKAYERLWGFPASHTVNKFNVLKSNEVKNRGLFEYVKRAYNGESVIVPEYEFDSSGPTEAQGIGNKRWLSTKIYPLKDLNGKVTNIVVTHEDITERKYAGFELENHRENLETLVTERTKELESINSELERLNSLFVGREFRIKELRDRVKELEKKVDE